jgi:hypothetical protein
MNKKLYLGIYTVSFAIAIIGAALAAAIGIVDLDPGSTIASAISTVAIVTLLQYLLVLTIYPFVLLAKMWGSIQDEWNEVTPIKAIVFLFIPFFNLYWIFRVWGGYATEYDNYVLRHDLSIAPLAGTVFLFYPLFAILGGLFLFPTIILPFLLFPMIGKACDAVNDLRTANGIA